MKRNARLYPPVAIATNEFSSIRFLISRANRDESSISWGASSFCPRGTSPAFDLSFNRGQ
ncbi:hypothetical protein WN48_00444 [Eufriesea mexicana]|nr:hypothetical protein WN48_00444 [Eufriesea mexicana]